jgi:cytochrome c556
MKIASVSHRLLFSAACLIAGISFAARAAEPEDIIKYRENVMKSQGAHLAAAAAIIQGKVDFKSQLREHTRALAASTNDIASLFPKGSDFGDTKALDAVWQKPAEFKKDAEHAHMMAVALDKAVAKGDAKTYPQHLKALVDACKDCHKDFRKEEK